jgi:uncharacterized repeat protein (TIGR01451 family)
LSCRHAFTIAGILLACSQYLLSGEPAKHKEDSPGPSHQGELARAAGGPDDFGYVFVDNREPVCVGLFSYVDISSTGNGTGLTGADDAYAGPFPIGFGFAFYGAVYDEFYLVPNGVVYFEDSDFEIGNRCPLPASLDFPPQTYIAPYHDDLMVQDDSDVYYQTFSDCPVGTGLCTVIQFAGLEDCCADDLDGIDFEVILYADGSVVFQYLQPSCNDSTQSDGASATVGIQGAGTWPPTHGLGYSCNAASLASGLAVAFAPPTAISAGAPVVCAGAAAESDLELSKVISSVIPSAQGTQLVYTLALTNHGPDSATGVVVTDSLPDVSAFVGDTCGGSLGGSEWTWAVGGLAADTSATCELTVAIGAHASGEIVNIAAVAGDQTDPYSANNYAQAVQAAQIAVPALLRPGLIGLTTAILGAALLLLRRLH